MSRSCVHGAYRRNRFRTTSLLVALALLTACVDAEHEEGARIDVQLTATSTTTSTGLPETLRLVLDHVELLACQPAPPTGLARMRESVLRILSPSTAHAAHLPPAPHRLLTSAVWNLREDGGPAPTWAPGTLRPPLRDWCGVRFGFYAALPDTPALEQGIALGQSLLAIFPPPHAETVRGSLGFDVVARQDNPSPWLSSAQLRQHPQTLTLHIDLDALAAVTEAAQEDGKERTPALLAQAFVDFATVVVAASDTSD